VKITIWYILLVYAASSILEYQLFSVSLSPMSKKRVIVPIILLILVFLVIGQLTRHLFDAMERSLYAERQNHLTEVTTQSARILSHTMKDSWELAFLFQAFLGDELQKNINIFENVKTFNRSHPDDTVGILLFDEKGHFYTEDGLVGKQSSLWRLTAERPERQVYIEKKTFLDSNEDMMYFLQRLPTPVKTQFDGREVLITHFAFARSIEYMLSRFYTEFRQSSNAFILDDAGLMLFKRYSMGILIEGSNYFNKLRRYCDFFHGEDVEQMISQLRCGKTCCAEAYYAGQSKKAFACMAQIEDTPWYLTFTVPTECLDSGASNRLTTIFWYLAGMVLLLGIAAVSMVIFVHRLVTERELLVKKEEANRFLEQAAQAAQEASVAKTEFLSHMSHDIRTPINGIMGMTELAKKNLQDSTKVASCLGKILISSHHLLALVNDVLDLSRIESGKTVISSASFNLSATVANCVSIIRGQINNRKLEFESDISGVKHPWVFGDDLHLRQILINILGNAVKFTPDGGGIYCKASEIALEGDVCRVQFDIRDTGIGMKPEFLQRIFDAFSQEDDGARSRYKGTGLGMAITKKYVELMGGTITVESTFGEGSLFTVVLPFPVDKNDHAQTAGQALSGISLKGARVLLAEDNEMNSEIARELLESEGLEVVCVEDGQQAVDCFMRNVPGTFDFILMDVMMPVMDGLQATMTIRSMERPDAKTIPILAMTANAFEEDVRRTREAGMNEHLSKPIELSYVLKALRNFYKGDHPRPPVV